jgi:hypothetical protein
VLSVATIFVARREIDLDSFRKIQVGMTENDITLALGRESRIPATNTNRGVWLTIEKTGGFFSWDNTASWEGHDRGVIAFFDEEGKVVGAEYCQIKGGENFIERILRSIGY